MCAKRDNTPAASSSGSEDETTPVNACSGEMAASATTFAPFREVRVREIHNNFLNTLRGLACVVLLVLAALAISNFVLVVEVKRELATHNSLGDSYDMLDFAPLFAYDPYNVTVAEHLHMRGDFMHRCFAMLKKEKEEETEVVKRRRKIQGEMGPGGRVVISQEDIDRIIEESSNATKIIVG